MTLSLESYRRLKLAQLPTPLEELASLSRTLKGPRILVKRDDCTGFALGGNKVRKLEFLVADALMQGADTLITAGGLQSNHVRQTAAAAARAGLGCEALLMQTLADPDWEYRFSGNVLLDQLFGARITRVPVNADLDDAIAASADSLVARGRKPYIIPVGGSTPIGAMGYVVCGLELAQQCRAQSLSLDYILLATGSAGTQAGLLVGLLIAGLRTSVVGICVSRSRTEQEAKIWQLVCETERLLGVHPGVLRTDVIAYDNYCGAGYGMPTQAMIDALHLVARQEGLLLDPVYSGKAMAGLIDLVNRGELTKEHTVAFLHTGGTPALFGYARTLQP